MDSTMLLLADLVTGSKRKLIATIVAIILFLVTVIGFIYTLIKNAAKNKAESIDIYLSDMVKYDILKDDKDVVKYTRKREIKNFFKRNMAGMIIFYFVLIVFVILMAVCFNNDYKGAWQIVDDLRFEFSKLEFIQQDNMSAIKWPTLIKSSKVTLSFFAYSVYTMLVATVIMLITVLRSSFIALAISFRVKKIKYRLFSSVADLKE